MRRNWETKVKIQSNTTCIKLFQGNEASSDEQKTTYSNLARVLMLVPSSPWSWSMAFHAGRPRIKCNNASSSGLARANPSFVNEGGGSRLRPRNAWWLLCQECAVVPIRGSQLCSRNNRHPKSWEKLSFSSFLSLFLSFLFFPSLF